MIGQLINKFDALKTPTVSEFNKLFRLSPLPEYVDSGKAIIDLQPDWEVEIGQPFGGTTREIIITAPDGKQFNTFIELRTEDTHHAKKSNVIKHKKLYGGIISSIINGTYTEKYGQGSFGTNNQASDGTGENDPEAIQEMDEE